MFCKVSSSRCASPWCRGGPGAGRPGHWVILRLAALLAAWLAALLVAVLAVLACFVLLGLLALLLASCFACFASCFSLPPCFACFASSCFLQPHPRPRPAGARRDPSTQTSKIVRKIIRISADNQATDTCTSTDTCTHQQNNKPEYMLKHKEVERTKVHRSTTKHILTHNIFFKRHNAGSMPVVTRGPPTPLAKPSHRGTDEHDL